MDSNHLLATLALAVLVGACGPDAAKDPATPSAQPTATAVALPVETTTNVAPSAQPSATATATTEAPKPPKTFPLAEFKLALSIDLPDDAKLAASESKDGLGGATVDSKTVNVRILKADAKLSSIATAKATLQKLKLKAAKTFVKEEADLLVYTRGDADFSFLVLIKQGGVTYACQSLGTAENEAALAAGIAACRSIKKS